MGVKKCACGKKALNDATRRLANIRLKIVFMIEDFIGSELADTRRFLVTITIS